MTTDEKVEKLIVKLRTHSGWWNGDERALLILKPVIEEIDLLKATLLGTCQATRLYVHEGSEERKLVDEMIEKLSKS